MKKLKPETDAEKHLATTPGGMRILMLRHTRDNQLLKSVDTAAVMFRMTELDRYTTLAYYALLALEETQERAMELASMSTRPLMVCATCAKAIGKEV